jgi:hypothetical protein
MALRLHRITDEQWQRLATARRTQDPAHPPARASIGAIQIELRALADSRPSTATNDEYREAAAG